MELTFVNDLGDTYVVDADPGYGLEHIMARLEEESGIPVQEQAITFDGVPLVGSKTMREFGVTDNSMLLLRRQRNIPVKERNAGQFIDGPSTDRGLQGQIEVASRQRAIMENMEHASEYIPKSFERVTMLYIPAEVNGHPVKALVNTYAQQTLISPGCAEACGILQLIDRRFEGTARGPATPNIVGRVYSTQLKFGDLSLRWSVTVVEDSTVDMQVGLDLLKAYRACIDLGNNVLRIQGHEIAFLSKEKNV